MPALCLSWSDTLNVAPLQSIYPLGTITKIAKIYEIYTIFYVKKVFRFSVRLFRFSEKIQTINRWRDDRASLRARGSLRLLIVSPSRLYRKWESISRHLPTNEN